MSDLKWQRLTSLLAMICVGLGLMSLIGWLTGNYLLISLISDGATMKANSALLLLAASVSLVLLNYKKKKAAIFLTCFVLLLSLGIIAEQLSGLNLHIDELLFKDIYTNPVHEHPGRVSLLTAINCFLSGIALLMLSLNRFKSAQLIACCVFLIVYISLIGHLFHISGFYHLGIYSGIAVHTALALICLAAGLLTIAAQEGWIALVYHRLEKTNFLYYFLIYFLGAAPLFATSYLFIIQHGGLSPASDIIVLITITLLLTLPVAYFMLRLVNTINTELTNTGQHLEVALEAARLGSYYLDVASGKMNVSDLCKSNFGLPKDAIFNFPDLLNAITPEYREMVQANVQEAIDNKANYIAEYQIYWPDGTLHWIAASGKPQYEPNGMPVSIIGVTQEITERKLAAEQILMLNNELGAANEELTATNEELAASNEEAFATNEVMANKNDEISDTYKKLEKSRQDLLFTIKATGLGTFDYNPRTDRFTSNEVLKSWFGLETKDEIELPSAIAVIIEQDKESVKLAIKYALDIASEGKFDIEFSIKNPADNEIRILYAKGQASFDEFGQPELLSGNVQDVTKEKNNIRSLEESKEQFSLIADNIAQLAWMTDETGYIYWYNQRWYDYTGTTLEEMLGWGWDKVQHPDHLADVVAKWSNNIKTGDEFEMTFPLRHRDGEYRWFLTRAVPMKDENGITLRWFGTNTDVHEQKEDEQRKNDFIGMVSHELKTPLTSLSAILQVANAKLKDSQDAFLPGAMAKASQQVKKMSTMINGFLNISRLESSKILIEKKIFNLEVVLTEAISEAQLTIPGYHFKFEQCDPVEVYADPDKIGSVISNLISNAAKYSPQSKDIEVKCKVIDKMARVSIKDNGLGIKEEDQQHLFDRYYRVQNANTRLISGFGIGLYLSAEIIQHHNGKIWVESEPGKGSTFYFTLPL